MPESVSSCNATKLKKEEQAVRDLLCDQSGVYRCPGGKIRFRKELLTLSAGKQFPCCETEKAYQNFFRECLADTLWPYNYILMVTASVFHGGVFLFRLFRNKLGEDRSEDILLIVRIFMVSCTWVVNLRWRSLSMKTRRRASAFLSVVLKLRCVMLFLENCKKDIDVRSVFLSVIIISFGSIFLTATWIGHVSLTGFACIARLLSTMLNYSRFRHRGWEVEHLLASAIVFVSTSLGSLVLHEHRRRTFAQIWEVGSKNPQVSSEQTKRE
eukprot:746671-Hanusia_phi.AAC.3